MQQPSHTYYAPHDIAMKALLGIRPQDDVWNGDLPEPVLTMAYEEAAEHMQGEMTQAISDLNLDVAQIEALDRLTHTYHKSLMVAVMTSARRIAVEFDGCEINTGVPRD